MKVVVFSGSPAREKSIGNKFLELVRKNLMEMDSDISMDIYIGSELNIRETDGSGNEFAIGRTLYNDDMTVLENALLASDFIIFLSPVYAHQVSSYMKKFIDRLSYWLHLYRLIGRYGYIISVSSNNGNEFVNDYLRSMMEYLGILVLGETSLETVKIGNDSILESYARFVCNKIIMAKDEVELDIPFSQAQNFLLEKENFMRKVGGFERDYWDKHGYFEMASFKELFLSNMKKRVV